jgi:para-nitrobenzyl esterase
VFNSRLWQAALAAGIVGLFFLRGNSHAQELSFLFDQLPARFGKNVTARDQAIARIFHRYFANFAKSGDPNKAGLPVWPKFDASNFDLMLFQSDGKARVRSDPWRER